MNEKHPLHTFILQRWEYVNRNTRIQDLHRFTEVVTEKGSPNPSLDGLAMREIHPTGGACSAVNHAAEGPGRTFRLQDPPRSLNPRAVSQTLSEIAFSIHLISPAQAHASRNLSAE
jgi:hypothetical protein